MQRLRNCLGLKGFAGVSSDGRSGGLALFWHEHLCIDIQSMNERHIDAYVRSSLDDDMWRLTCVYGEPRVEDRHHMWELLQQLRGQVDVPWLVMGDFNEAMWQFEHFSSRPRNETQMLAFRDTLELCGLVDLGFSGVPYTFDNKQREPKNVKVRLDRAVANFVWRDRFL